MRAEEGKGARQESRERPQKMEKEGTQEGKENKCGAGAAIGKEACTRAVPPEFGGPRQPQSAPWAEAGAWRPWRGRTRLPRPAEGFISSSRSVYWEERGKKRGERARDARAPCRGAKKRPARGNADGRDETKWEAEKKAADLVGREGEGLLGGLFVHPGLLGGWPSWRAGS